MDGGRSVIAAPPEGSPCAHCLRPLGVSILEVGQLDGSSSEHRYCNHCHKLTPKPPGIWGDVKHGGPAPWDKKDALDDIRDRRERHIFKKVP